MQRYLVCSTAIFLAASTSASAQSFTYSDFTSTAGLNLVQRAATVGNILRVHDNMAPLDGTNRGAVWYQTPVNVASGFDTTFVFNMNGATSTGGGDGMAFVIQNDMQPSTIATVGNMAIGNHASACGYGIFSTSAPGVSVDNSLAIELDCFNNGNQPAGAPILDPDGNHISIHTNGTGDNNQQEAFSIGRAPSSALGTDMNNGQNHTLRVRYVPGTIEVYLDGSLVLSRPYSFQNGGTWIDSQMPVGGLNLIGGGSAYVGITASSGSVRENHDLVSWTFDSSSLGTNYCPAVVNTSGAPASISATGSNSVGSNAMSLVSSSMPANQFGFFLTSQTQGLVMNPGGSQGNLCIGGTIGRYVAPGQIKNGGAGGTFSLALNLTQTPAGPVFVSIASGQTWNFQAWFRDIGPAGQPWSNFTNGLSVTFTN